MGFFELFIDPVLRAPLIGSMLMSFSASIIGVLAFIQKRSLLAETLSHATYPGVVLAILLAGFFSIEDATLFVLTGAFISSLLGLLLIHKMEKKLKVSSDASLCFVLVLFFGVGITLASYVQMKYSSLFWQIQAYLYGQSVTMTDQHIALYGGFSLFVLAMVILFYKPLQIVSFDRSFAKSFGLNVKGVEILTFLLMTFSIVIGIRCVGVILMSAMLIAPAASARQFTNRLSSMFAIAALFAMVSACLGTYFSLVLSKKFSFSTGPMIVLVSGVFSIFALLFAPERGIFIRFVRSMIFRSLTIQENILKSIWRVAPNRGIFLHEIAQNQGFSKLYLVFLVYLLVFKSYLRKEGKLFFLTGRGVNKGAQIVRLHRLWEAYLFYSLGLKLEKVHKSAEEMEHILTPELEKRLTELLDDPKQDPHDQPIPPYEQVLK